MSLPLVKKVSLTTVVMAAMLFLALGSETPPTSYNATNEVESAIKFGRVEGSIKKIVAADGSFVLEGGKQFKSPFQSSLWGSCSSLNNSNLLANPDQALACGAKQVKVYIKGRSEPLYGVLALNTTIGAAYGPASRSYLIKVADDKFHSAISGNNAVSFETQNYKSVKRWTHTYSDSVSEKSYYSWVLWLSSYPL